jgi:glycerol-1-phosphate dehydrogenase [NAD(P)+]
MPLLARMVPTPLVVDVRRGVLDSLAPLLADQRISTGGRVAVVVGGTSGEALRERLAPGLPQADWFVAPACSIDVATALTEQLRSSSYDAVVGIGGGRVLDTTKFVAARLGLPMVAVATNLAHDGIASPVSILDNETGRGSYGVPLPIAVVVDLDHVRASPRDMVVAGIGDALSNLSAIADWELSREHTGEAVDGLAVTLARTAAEALLYRTDDVEDDTFLVSLAEALVLSGIAMAVCGTTRPCSGGCHEISHAIDTLYPAKSGAHGFQVGVGALFATYLRGDEQLFRDLAVCLDRHGLPTTPDALGLSDDEFVAVVRFAPETRPGRYTVLEHLDLDEAQVRERLAGFRTALAGALAARH